MSIWDWITLGLTLLATLLYGLYKSKGQDGSDTYLMAGKSVPWYMVLLGIMATQASAITFLSAPGQAYTDGMRFLQYYFGLPIAMVVICITFIPVFRKLNVLTAYQYLEYRFDKKTRGLISILFLFSRGLSTGISIYAPAIILSSIFDWNIYLSNLLIGGLLIIYTYSGGAKAIAHTQKLQFGIILGAITCAFFIAVYKLPANTSFSDALYLAGKSGKLNIIDTSFNLKEKYNIWSGIIGGFFLALSYFGTDQSQVGRYITASSANESRKGLLLNGLVKIPMQFFILLIGALLFSLYTLQKAPLSFNENAAKTYTYRYESSAGAFNARYENIQATNRAAAQQLLTGRHAQAPLDTAVLRVYKVTQEQMNDLRDGYKKELKAAGISSDDTNYIFLYFVKNSLPIGMVGLLFAVIFLASWGSISAALNSLAASSMVDIQYLFRRESQESCKEKELRTGRIHTLAWGIFCIAVAMFATRMGSLIEAVNVLGSLFYGTILGVFLVAFYLKKVRGFAVFWAAIITELVVVLIYLCDIFSFLWLNVVGTVLVLLIAAILQLFSEKKTHINYEKL